MAKLNGWDRSYSLQSLKYLFTWSFIENICQLMVSVNGAPRVVGHRLSEAQVAPLQRLPFSPASEVPQWLVVESAEKCNSKGKEGEGKGMPF